MNFVRCAGAAWRGVTLNVGRVALVPLPHCCLVWLTLVRGQGLNIVGELGVVESQLAMICARS